MDANEIGPGIVCGTGAGCSGGVGTSKKAFPSVIRLVKSDFCDVWCFKTSACRLYKRDI